MFNAGDRQIALCVHGFHSAKADPGYGRSMIGIVAADEDFAVRLPLHLQ
jgi:hypothetical protein